MTPRNNSELIEGWKINYEEVSNNVWKVSVEDRVKRRFEVISFDLDDGIEQCRTYALGIEKVIRDKIAAFNPWNFSVNSPQTYSCNKTHRIIYRGLREIAQGSPLMGKAFLLNDLDVTILIDESAGGLPIWNKSKNIVAIPLWSKDLFNRHMQRIAVIDPAAKQLSVFKKEFSIIQFDDFAENIITFFDNPLNQKKRINFDILAEPLYETRFIM